MKKPIYILGGFILGLGVGGAGSWVFWRQHYRREEMKCQEEYEILRRKLRENAKKYERYDTDTPASLVEVAVSVPQMATDESVAMEPTKAEIEAYQSRKEGRRIDYRTIAERNGYIPPKPELDDIVKSFEGMTQDAEGNEAYVEEDEDGNETLRIEREPRRPAPVEPLYDDPDYPVPPVGPDGWRPPYPISAIEFAEGGPSLIKATITYYSEDGTLADEHEQPMDTIATIGDGALGLFDNASTIYVRNEKLGTDFEVLWDERSYHYAVIGADYDMDMQAYEKFRRRRGTREDDV